MGPCVSAAPTHWLYPVSSTSDYVLPRPGGEAVALSPDTVWEDVQAQHPGSTDWFLVSGFHIMRAGDLIWIYATEEYQYVCALARVVRVFWDDVNGHCRVEMMWDLEVCRALHDNPITRADFGGQRVPRVQRAAPAAAGVLGAWLAKRRVTPRTPDAPEGAGSEAEARAWTLRQIRQRQGPGRLRAQLLELYRGQCAITGELCQDVLEAAHIELFATSEDHAVTNGLLLRSDLHTLFDLHLIGVDTKGALVVSPQITSQTYRALAGTKLTLPKSRHARPSAPALAEHLAALPR